MGEPLLCAKSGSLFFVGSAVDNHDSYYGYSCYGQDKLRRIELFSSFAQEGTAIFEQVVHVLGFALKYVYGTLYSADNVLKFNFIDLLKLVSHEKGKFGVSWQEKRPNSR